MKQRNIITLLFLASSYFLESSAFKFNFGKKFASAFGHKFSSSVPKVHVPKPNLEHLDSIRVPSYIQNKPYLRDAFAQHLRNAQESYHKQQSLRGAIIALQNPALRSVRAGMMNTSPPAQQSAKSASRSANSQKFNMGMVFSVLAIFIFCCSWSCCFRLLLRK